MSESDYNPSNLEAPSHQQEEEEESGMMVESFHEEGSPGYP